MTQAGAGRGRLSRERVLRAGVALADSGGLESLTMRRLGEDLGVEAMSLYKHVANKDALLDGMVDLVFAEIELPAGDTDWRTAMRDRADLRPRGAGPPPLGHGADAVAHRARPRDPDPPRHGHRDPARGGLLHRR